MKKIMMAIACVCAFAIAAFAGDDEVTVKVSVAGVNNSALKKQCEVQGKKAQIRLDNHMLWWVWTDSINLRNQ